MRLLIGVSAVIVAMATAVPSASAAVCADYSTQAQAQRAADTRDQDGDGLYCEELPCPCSGPGQASKPKATPKRDRSDSMSCVRTRRVVRVELERDRYPAVLRHMRRAIRDGWPRILKLNRDGADRRRERLLDDDRYPTRPGKDRDEWPMAFARRSWRADVAYVPSGQNRGAGASVGNQVREYCDGVRFRIIAVA